MPTDRRTFLKAFGSGAIALGAGLAPRRARAAGEDRRFVFVYFSGGWDTLLCLDPRDPSVFTEDRIGSTRIQLAWDRLPAGFERAPIQPAGSNIAFGPAAAAIAPHFERACVVRGLSMDTVTHEVGRRYMITGMTPRGLTAAGSSIGTRVAAQQGDLRPIPHLVSRVEAYNEGLPVFATGLAVNGAADLKLTLQDGPQAPTGVVRRRLDAWRAQATSCDPAALDRGGLHGLIRETQLKARSLVSSGIARHFDLDATGDPEIAALRQRYGITSTAQITPGSQAALAFQALRHDVAQTVSVELVGGLDTHDDGWASDHPTLLAAGFEALAQLVQDLVDTPAEGGGRLIDRTTIVAFSEFGRTALLNNREGRDHSLCSAALLLGAGVPHNRVVGASTDVGMNPRSIDPSSGRPDDAGVALTPTRLLASVMASAGLSTEALRTDGLPALMST
jgi:uncharacterized protein (DUF1501 family)